MTIDELIAAHQEQITNLAKIREAMVPVSTDRAMSLKEVVAFLSAGKESTITLTVTCGGRDHKDCPHITWSICVGDSWAKDKREGKGASLADAFRALQSPMSNIDKLSEEL